MMPARTVPTPLIVGLIVALAAVVGFLAWRAFAPPSNNLDGKTEAQQAEMYRKAREQMMQRGEQGLMNK